MKLIIAFLIRQRRQIKWSSVIWGPPASSDIPVLTTATGTTTQSPPMSSTRKIAPPAPYMLYVPPRSVPPSLPSASSWPVQRTPPVAPTPRTSSTPHILNPYAQLARAKSSTLLNSVNQQPPLRPSYSSSSTTTGQQSTPYATEQPHGYSWANPHYGPQAHDPSYRRNGFTYTGYAQAQVLAQAQAQQAQQTQGLGQAQTYVPPTYAPPVHLPPASAQHARSQQAAAQAARAGAGAVSPVNVNAAGAEGVGAGEGTGTDDRARLDAFLKSNPGVQDALKAMMPKQQQQP